MRLQIPGSELIVNIGTHKQLFVDDHIIETTRWVVPRTAETSRWLQPPVGERDDLDGWKEEDDRVVGDVPGHLLRATAFVTRTVNQPQRYEANPIMGKEYEWEGKSAPHPAAILFDEEEGLWKMWYCGLKVEEFPERSVWYHTMYAISEDGIRWQRPALDVELDEAGQGTGIVYRTKCQYVVKDPIAPPARRYKMGHGGHQPELFHSPDGVHWTADPGPLDSGRGDETLSVMYDPVSKKYLGFCRNPYPRPMLVHRTERSVLRMQSNDLVHWSMSTPVLDKDPSDPFDTDFYGMETMFYESMYLGFVRVHHTAPDNLDMWLAYSRDSFNWQRLRHRPFLPNGPADGWECGLASMFQAPLRVGDELWIYYTGTNGPHDAQGKETQVGLAKLRLDGFVSIDAFDNDHKNKAAEKNYPPTLLTRPLYSTGNRLVVNAAVQGEGGFVEAELLTLDGYVIEGFGRQDCDSFSGDSLAHTFSWQGREDIGSHLPVRVRFYMDKAKLYALQMPRV